LVGTVLGERYELKEKIGEGGMADVYTAHCRILERIVAVKILKEKFSQDKNFVDKFKTEALAAARLSHPNIVNIFDVGQEKNLHYIVMEYVEGQTLQEIIKEQAPLSVKRAVDIAVAICYGIQHAHERGIIHRDIKPHNILVTSQGTVKVADFGIAQAINKKTITFSGEVEGSVHYISPEQAKGEPVSPATDIYSLACVLYEMLTGKPPFDAESMITVALKHIHDEPEAPRDINPLTPLPLEKIVLKAMEKLPANRYETASAMCEDLLQVQANLHVRSNGIDNINNGFMSHGDGEGDMMAKKRKLSPIGIILIIAAVIGFFSGVVFVFNDSLFGEDIIVPEIVGMELKEANKTLLDNGLKMNIKARNYSDKVELDKIISQKPAEGQKVKKGREIEVIVSKGPQLQKIPNLLGTNLADAKIKISNSGFETGVIEKKYDDKFKENRVISQEPEFGTSAKKGTAINLLISEGKAPNRVAMPNLVGLKLEKARELLQVNNLIQGNITWEESQEYHSNYVIAQDTAAGILVNEESAVDLKVSKGPGPVAKTRVLQFNLPTEEEYYNVLVIVNDVKGEREVYNEFHEAGARVNIAVSYFGSGTAEVQINGKEFQSYNL